MNIGEIGRFFNSTIDVDYFSTISLLEFDALIIDLTYLLRESQYHSYEFFVKRKSQLEEFIAIKKVPIIYFLPQKTFFPVLNEGVMATRSCDFFVPVPQLLTENESGTLISIAPKTPFFDFLTKYKDYISYNAFLNNYPGKVILETLHKKKPLGFYTESCVFLPQFKEKLKNREADFLTDLIECTRKSLRSESSINFPKWADKYLLPGENDIKIEISQAQSKISELEELITAKEGQLQDRLTKKLLFTGTGSELEIEVEKTFKELGFEILEAEAGRDDLIVKYNGKTAVIEIKGVSKSAAEKHAAQLEKWTANYIEKHGNIPKAILLVNTFKDIPPEERVEVSYPDQMLKYSTQRDHCLITTIQLLKIYFKALTDPSEKETLINSIFNTVGKYDDNIELKDIITILPQP